MAKRRTKPQPNPQPGLGHLLRGEIVGGVLVVLALVIFLTLLSANRGEITGVLVDGLRLLFGAGTWLAPFLMGALGLWLALHEITSGEVLSARRLAGATGLFVVGEAIVHLAANAPDPLALAMAGGGGGLLGWLIGQTLVAALGLPATIGVLIVLLLLVLFAISGLTFAQVRAGLGDPGRWMRDAVPRPDGLKVIPSLPLGVGDPPLRRWWRQVQGWLAANPPPKSVASPTLPSNWTSRPPAPSPTRSIAPPPPTRSVATPQPAPAPAPIREAAPRIIGSGGQSWRLPVLRELLEDSTEQEIQGEDIRRRAQIIEATLEGFGVPVQVVEANQGPAVTQFGLRPGIVVKRSQKGEEKRIKVRVSQIQALANDLSLALAASPLRIEAPVPGRDIVGVEVPNVQTAMVSLRGVMEAEEFTTASAKGALPFGLGRDVSGQAVVADLARMPHLLIAGATGSGKSVCVNAVITALLLTHTPDTLRFLMVDPKRVELTVYNGIPHLIAPVVVDVERALPVLQWATREMERRYKLFAKAAARNIEAYNEKLAAHGEQTLPYVVILIDELADLMLSAPEDVERSICRIAQMARATGIHLVIATQRPSVDVVTGLIKANFPARIAFAVTSQIDSRVILDTPGAEQLLGRGDMLFMAPDASKLQRLQGCFVSDKETTRLVNFWKGARTFGPEMPALDAVPVPGAETPGVEPAAPPSPIALPGPHAKILRQPAAGPLDPPWLPGQETLQQPLWDDVAAAQAAGDKDDMYVQAVAEVRKSGRASVSLLQRRLRVGYSRAARLIEQMEAEGIVGPDLGGSRGREVLPGGEGEIGG